MIIKFCFDGPPIFQWELAEDKACFFKSSGNGSSHFKCWACSCMHHSCVRCALSSIFDTSFKEERSWGCYWTSLAIATIPGNQVKNARGQIDSTQNSKEHQKAEESMGPQWHIIYKYSIFKTFQNYWLIFLLNTRLNVFYYTVYTNQLAVRIFQKIRLQLEYSKMQNSSS